MNIKTKRMICLLVGIASVLTIIGTVSYAYFTAISEINNQTATLSTGTARVTFRDGDTGMTGELSFGESITKKFTIENTGTVEANVKMYFKDLINTYGVGSLTYILTQAEFENGTYTEVVNKTDVPRSSRPSKKRLVDQLTIPVGKTYYYELVITLNYLPDVNQDADINARFSSTFEIEDINEPEAPLPELMKVTREYNEKLWAHRDAVKKIVFETTETPRENAAYTYDLSASQDGSIMSYLYPDTEDSTKFIAYIQSEEGIKANQNSSYLFHNFINLEQIDNLYYLDTSNIVNMYAMFYACNSLISLDVSSFDTNKVTNMGAVFGNCYNLASLNISNFDTSNVTDMHSMFSACKLLTSLDLSNFDTSNVTNMNSMFSGCTNLTTLNISNFNTSNVTSMDSIFKGCKLLTSLDVSNFDTSRVTIMRSMFEGCNSLITLDLSNFDTSNVTNMERMFNLGYLNKLITLDLSNFNTSNVTNMASMFSGCSGLTSLDISNFDTSSVTTMYELFYNCSGLTTLDVSNFDTDKVTTMKGMFSGCSGLTTLDVSKFNTSNVTNMQGMFSGCSGLTSLDVSKFDTSNVTNMQGMFSGCSGLTSLDVSKFDTSNVTNMQHMFASSGVTSLDLSTFKTNSLTNTSRMFINCKKLTNLNIKNWDISKVTQYDSIFSSVPSAIKIRVSNSTMRQWVIDKSDTPKLTTSNVTIG